MDEPAPASPPTEILRTKLPFSVKTAGILLVIGSAILIFLTTVSGLLLHQRGLLAGARLRLWLYWVLLNTSLVVWAVSTTVGLFRLRAWARVSILAISLLALYHFAWASLGLYLFTPALRSHGPLWGRGLSLLQLGIAGLAGLSLWEFSAHDMDEVFQRPEAAGSLPEPSAGAPAEDGNAPAAPVTGRGLSIRVIGVWLIAVCVLALCKILANTYTILVPPPDVTFSASFPYSKDLSVLAAVLGLLAGYGLLRRNEKARTGAVALCILTIVSTVVEAARPGYLAGISASLPGHYLHLSSFSSWVLALWVIAAWAVPLYFLITRRAYFQKADTGPAGTEL